MIKKVYVKPTIEVEVLAFEQGFSLSTETEFVVPGGGNNGGEDEWV
jgi:hypothetical protein